MDGLAEFLVINENFPLDDVKYIGYLEQEGDYAGRVYFIDHAEMSQGFNNLVNGLTKDPILTVGGSTKVFLVDEHQRLSQVEWDSPEFKHVVKKAIVEEGGVTLSSIVEEIEDKEL